ncbi:calcium-dependent protein kinase family protein [Striga asiatica]|uniref:Calcium-dependent protein kinase family protein n=1 Tax=Striga asiatica TaxID=4170 RepID=A0A5A7RIN7_STRAF|nr:calcium-dependent protein kinase family protein [Striga asiatica]
MGSVVGKDGPQTSLEPKSKLDAKIIEALRRREVKGSSIKSFNTIILKFPKIDESFRKCKTTFEEFDEDGNGAIDPEELKRCFRKLEFNFSDEEIKELFEACDINEDMRMKFNEFIVLLCLVYLLKEDQPSQQAIGMPSLGATFETIVDTFVFLDKNRDGCVSRDEMIDAINETNSGERSSGRIAMKRFEEMDWDKNGMVNLKEFLFAFTHWVGIEDADDNEAEHAS